MNIDKFILSSKDGGQKLQQTNPGDYISPLPENGKASADIETDLNRTRQEIMGFGGAFTEAAALSLSKLNPRLREEALEAYFHPERGHGYSLGRVHIHSCDFALSNYTYVEEHDESLDSFDISHDREHIIPMIRDAFRMASKDLKLLASPWSPPGWMKTNGEMNNGGKLLPRYRDAWARYYVKFIRAYDQEEIPLWGISVQNEPAAVQIWDSCIFSGEEERDFVRDHLGPCLRENGLKDIKLLIWDHNRDIMAERAEAVLSDPEAAQYVWGTGYHWYVSEEFSNLSRVHDAFPDKHLLFTEGCQEGGCKIGEWFTGERYARNMIGDFNNWCEGYIDWNLVLDETGGPNHVNNLCDAPIIADTLNDRLIYNSSYYYIGHFSRFVPPGSKALELSRKATGAASHAGEEDRILWAAFLRPDGSIAAVAMNEGDDGQSSTLRIGAQGFELRLPAHSIATIILKA
ncbi:glycoside hydrolase family 30 protein [Salinispira pacifica]|uniref:O-Glycosyl hydrolase family 30 n=1 Tax=Salinispira pacifica TaxID=1307761 RepID=V5WG98_9SPIO|nr:glycoside hydrolase family 30 protein [Salinispira pacifica]AHC14191.1 O-Glycosyl hydrolase family 30 [Salinispira pacifica]